MKKVLTLLDDGLKRIRKQMHFGSGGVGPCQIVDNGDVQ